MVQKIETALLQSNVQNKYLKQKIDANSAAVGFMHGLAAYIAAAHQEGEGNRPARTLLGFSSEDMRTIEETVVRHLERDS